jgi:glyoxylase-like metal-dependent hydrolase (beta-lactamase superfamily II)/8-oxo-dGTP pyrophosphatase MutT (NUDIX family)
MNGVRILERELTTLSIASPSTLTSEIARLLPRIAMPRTTVPRRASTILIARDHEGALQVLMLRRSMAATFMPGAYVFPGGAVDACDAGDAVSKLCDEAEAEARLRLCIPDGALPHAVAALRECFEECGLWLGSESGVDASALAAARRRLTDGAGMVEIAGLLAKPLATRCLAPWSHWVTPIDSPKRFDTRFFVALAPPGQVPAVDASETISLVWVSPDYALTAHSEGALPLEFATRSTLESLLAFPSAAALMSAACAPREIAAIHPRVARTGAGVRRVLLPSDEAYAEVMRKDPDGCGGAVCTLDVGQAVQLAPAVWRVTAPNSSPMTGPGTNSYLVGRDQEYVIIDPGPAMESHVAALLDARLGRLRAVLVTHTHADHSQAAQIIAQRSRVPCIGLPPPPHGRHDRTFAPDVRPEDGERLSLAGCELQAIHTPGHASNHVCWWLAESRMLFTGDHMNQGSTVVIDPPDGDMAAYLASLRALSARLPELECLAPGHGFLMDRPHIAIEMLLLHRQAREATVIASLHHSQPRAIDELLDAVYADVVPDLRDAARRSLLAHLLKLGKEGRAAERAGYWTLEPRH